MDHFYKNVAGWACFTDLYQKMVAEAKDGATFVEVGSWLGRSAAFMAVEIINSGKAINFVCIDPWEDGGPDLRDTEYFKGLKEPVRRIFDINTAPVSGNIRPLQMTSVEGAATFADKSVDFIMLDGDHSYEAVKADLEAWLPKMKPGAVISGDDYLWPGVCGAVTERFRGGPTVHTAIMKEKPNYRNSVSYWWVKLP